MRGLAQHKSRKMWAACTPNLTPLSIHVRGLPSAGSAGCAIALKRGCTGGCYSRSKRCCRSRTRRYAGLRPHESGTGWRGQLDARVALADKQPATPKTPLLSQNTMPQFRGGTLGFVSKLCRRTESEATSRSKPGTVSFETKPGRRYGRPYTSCSQRTSEDGFDDPGEVICSMIQRSTSRNIWGDNSWPPGYCRRVTESPAVWNNRKSSHTFSAG